MDIEKIVENIQCICREKGTNPTEAGRESGAGPNMVSIMKRRGSFPSIEKMSMLAAYLGVTTSELLGEEKEPPAQGGGLSEPEKKVLESFRAVPEEDQEMVIQMIEAALKSRGLR